MVNEHQIVRQVYAAKKDIYIADSLIRSFVPFIRSETSKFLSRICSEQDDEFSISMIAFHEAIQSYEKSRGAFLNFASLLIRNRLIDHHRREMRHQGQISLYEKYSDQDDRMILDTIPDRRDYQEESLRLEATKQEIEELSEVMKTFGVSFSDISEHCPKQERTLQSCAKAIRYAAAEEGLLDEFLRTKKLPMARLVSGSGVERKTLERHRKYILAMLLIQTNGYEIIRGHLRHVLKEKGGSRI